VVGEMGDCGCCEGVGWLQMRTHASQLLCLLARDKPIRRTLTDRSCHQASAKAAAAMMEMAGLTSVSHFAVTPYRHTHTSRLHFTH
jgi:hypothetical protein